jgi:hypothetical protein
MAVMAIGLLAADPAGAAMREPLRTGGASSNAHRSDPSGNYGVYKGRPRPPYSARGFYRRGGMKEPYPSRYYYDTDPSITGCRRLARRAIDTGSATWWARYRACRG